MDYILPKIIWIIKTIGSLFVYPTYAVIYAVCVQFSSVAQLCLTLCDLMDCSMQSLPVHHQLPDFTQTHVH